jgi:peptidyl-prolyl cis-trans isomerase C
MKPITLLAALAMATPLVALAQNVAIVNGKAVPKARVEALAAQVARQPGQKPPQGELEKQLRDEVVMREIFMQEAERRGLQSSAEYKQQMELARQGLLIRELFEDYKKKNPVTDDEVKTEYEKLKAQSNEKEYRARHILVEKEDEAKSLLDQLKKGAKFEELAKKSSKDPGSAQNGGDLDWATPSSYVAEFSQAMTKLEKGQVVDTPVKSQFGWHIIKLDDVRDPQFPPLADVTPQLKQRLEQQKLAKFRDDLKNKAKTDYKWGS